MKTFIIKRSKWARGDKNGPSMLLNDAGAMCCLGFFSKKLGATKGQLFDVPAPHCLVRKLVDEGKSKAGRKWKGLLRGLVKGRLDYVEPTALAEDIMPTNDIASIDETSRERRLTEMFAKLGWKPKFID